jgi:site-specific DNA recombinase
MNHLHHECELERHIVEQLAASGWHVVDRKLVPNPAEAQVVREMFTRFALLPSMGNLIRELRDRGVTTKTWMTGKGVMRQNKLVDKAYVYRIFNNPVYIGVAAYKGQHFPGEHEPIIERELWDAVQESLQRGEKKATGDRVMKVPACRY